MTEKLEMLKKKYYNVLKEIGEYDKNESIRKTIATALYFATYYHPDNEDYLKYKSSNGLGN